MAREDNISIEELRNALDYCPDTGVLRWKYRPDVSPHINSRDVGKEAGNRHHSGRIYLGFRGRLIGAHRAAFAIFYGRWPNGQIDHINRDPKDNRISNLREATNSQNMCNRSPESTNRLGVKGVRPSGGSFNARITINKKYIDLGSYATIEEEKAAYDSAAEKYHGDFRPIEVLANRTSSVSAKERVFYRRQPDEVCQAAMGESLTCQTAKI
jgi:hypothetical protein